MNKLDVRPLADRVIIERMDERKTKGGIVIPETSDNKSQKGRVVAVGPGKIEDGILQKLSLGIGDKVIFGKYAGTEVNITGKDYLIMREDDVIAVLED
ncbi:MAG: co-chaperone GroES [Deltaproteobacteria bacterium]